RGVAARDLDERTEIAPRLPTTHRPPGALGGPRRHGRLASSSGDQEQEREQRRFHGREGYQARWAPRGARPPIQNTPAIALVGNLDSASENCASSNPANFARSPSSWGSGVPLSTMQSYSQRCRSSFTVAAGMYERIGQT